MVDVLGQCDVGYYHKYTICIRAIILKKKRHNLYKTIKIKHECIACESNFYNIFLLRFRKIRFMEFWKKFSQCQ
jgi:hypothetical protein